MIAAISRHRLALALGIRAGMLLSAFLPFGGIAHADEQYTVCIGDRPLCSTGAWFSCGTSIDQAAQAVCTRATPTAQTVSKYTFSKQSNQPGGRCGSSVFVVTCKR